VVIVDLLNMDYCVYRWAAEWSEVSNDDN